MNLLAGWLAPKVFAAFNPANPTFLPPQAPLTNVGRDVPLLAHVVVDWIFWGLIVIAVIMFLVGGYRYATSGGDPEKVSNANKTLRYAVIAVVVAILAAGVPALVASFFLGGIFIPW